MATARDPLLALALATLRCAPVVGAAVPLDTLDAALDAAAAEAARGIECTLAYVGSDPGAGRDPTAPYVAAAEGLAARGLPGALSVKLSHLGLEAAPDACAAALEFICRRAAHHRVTVWIDMEAPHLVDAALTVFRRVHATHAALGVCLQAYLRRSAADADSLVAAGAAIRLVKGSYLQPRTVAFRSRRAVRRQYVRLGARLLSPDARAAGVRVTFATHDLRLLGRLQDHAWSRGLGRDAFECHMLRGLRVAAQRRLVTQGYPVRVLISYGDGWLGWYARRMAERPANLAVLLRGLLG